jgi:FkbM family methyltransferase
MKKYLVLIIIILFIFTYEYYGEALHFKYKNNLKINGVINYIYIYNEIFKDKDYGFLDEQKENVVYFDVGGNNGIYSMYLNENNKNIEVHVFEPILDLYQNIVWNTNQIKKESNKFIINNLGLGNIKQELEINYLPNADGLSTIKNDLESKKEAIIKTKCKFVKDIPVVCNLCESVTSNLLNSSTFDSIKKKIKIDTLDNYISANNINKIDYLKVDIEGYELEFLQGISANNFKKIGKMVIEVENYRENYTKQILDILNKNNFKYDINDLDSSWILIRAKNNFI